MVEVAAADSLPPLTLEDRFCTLETKFAEFEKKYSETRGFISTPPEHLTSESTTIAMSQRPSRPERQRKVLSRVSRLDIDDRESTAQLPEDLGAGSNPRAKIIINKYDTAAGERKDYPLSDTAVAISTISDVSHAFMLRKYMEEDPERNRGEIDIIDPRLWTLLKELLGHYPYHIFQGPPTMLESPYEALILYWDKLEQAVNVVPKDGEDKQARSDLKLLLESISNSSGDSKLDRYFKTRDSNKSQKSVTFDTLWTIFPPGSLVYGQPFQGQDQVLIVQDSVRKWPHLRRRSPQEKASWSLICWTYDWDGHKFRRTPLTLSFEFFDSHKPITSLPYYPFELHAQQLDIKLKLKEQGMKYRQICTATQGSQMFEYNGNAISVRRGFPGLQMEDDREDDGISRSIFDIETEIRRGHIRPWLSKSSGLTAKSTKVEGRVMVDFESYYRYGPPIATVGSLIPGDNDRECGCSECRTNDGLRAGYRAHFDQENRQKDEWEEEQYMLCPPRVLGYMLRDKQWAQLQVSLLQNIPHKDANDSWSKRLEMADGNITKDMILNLVKGHDTGEKSHGADLQVDDIIDKKGKGLVILLYGPPGVGKTSTAEIVAVAARKPLFAISVADVGTKATSVEANLEKIFALATSWQAVLLIDEADVFLESRGKGVANNTERNALVSGILMLTTNQIANFDVAVRSRIHVAIKYVELDQRQTKAIFLGFLRPLAERGFVKDMREIEDWLQEDVIGAHLDGRQIRNIMTSALSLARAQRKQQIDKGDIKTMFNNVKRFKEEYVKQYERYKSEQQGIWQGS